MRKIRPSLEAKDNKVKPRNEKAHIETNLYVPDESFGYLGIIRDYGFEITN